MSDNKTEKDVLINVIRYVGLNPPVSMFHDKTIAYRERYKSWAIKFIDQPYLRDTIEHKLTLLSSMLIINPELSQREIDFTKGASFMANLLYKDIVNASVMEINKSDIGDEEPKSLQDLLSIYNYNG